MIKGVQFKCARTNGQNAFVDTVSRTRTISKGTRGYISSFDKVLDDMNEVRETMDAEKLAVAATQFWNDTLRPHDTARIFIKVVD